MWNFLDLWVCSFHQTCKFFKKKFFLSYFPLCSSFWSVSVAISSSALTFSSLVSNLLLFYSVKFLFQILYFSSLEVLFIPYISFLTWSCFLSNSLFFFFKLRYMSQFSFRYATCFNICFLCVFILNKIITPILMVLFANYFFDFFFLLLFSCFLTMSSVCKQWCYLFYVEIFDWILAAANFLLLSVWIFTLQCVELCSGG